MHRLRKGFNWFDAILVCHWDPVFLIAWRYSRFAELFSVLPKRPKIHCSIGFFTICVIKRSTIIIGDGCQPCAHRSGFFLLVKRNKLLDGDMPISWVSELFVKDTVYPWAIREKTTRICFIKHNAIQYWILLHLNVIGIRLLWKRCYILKRIQLIKLKSKCQRVLNTSHNLEMRKQNKSGGTNIWFDFLKTWQQYQDHEKLSRQPNNQYTDIWSECTEYKDNTKVKTNAYFEPKNRRSPEG